MNTLDAILSRNSCHGYTDEQITEEQLEKLLIAANAGPVGMKRFENIAISVLQSKELFNEMEAAFAEAMPDFPNKHPLYNAPTGILVAAKVEEGPMAPMFGMSASCIIENIMIEAADLGLGSTFLMGVTNLFKMKPEFCEKAGVPEGFTVIGIAAVGYSAEANEKKPAITDKFATTYIK